MANMEKVKVMVTSEDGELLEEFIWHYSVIEEGENDHVRLADNKMRVLAHIVRNHIERKFEVEEN